MIRGQFKDRRMQFKDDLRQQWGKFADDDLQQIERNNDKFIGEAHEVGGPVASEDSAGSHKGNDALTGWQQDEQDRAST